MFSFYSVRDQGTKTVNSYHHVRQQFNYSSSSFIDKLRYSRSLEIGMITCCWHCIQMSKKSLTWNRCCSL